MIANFFHFSILIIDLIKIITKLYFELFECKTITKNNQIILNNSTKIHIRKQKTQNKSLLKNNLFPKKNNLKSISSTQSSKMTGTASTKHFTFIQNNKFLSKRISFNYLSGVDYQLLPNSPVFNEN